jgi:hypothetical protein
VYYVAGQGAVRDILKQFTGRAFSVHDVMPQDEASSEPGSHAIRLWLRGRRNLQSLVVAVSDLRAVTSVRKISAPPTQDPNLSPH